MIDPDLIEVIEKVGRTIGNTLSSPNEMDSNGEAANVVDGLFAIARGLHHVAEAIEAQTEQAK